MPPAVHHTADSHTTVPLRNFFASLIQKQTPTHPQVGTHCLQTTVGESPTEDEAKERIRMADEEKKKKEEEKAEKAEIRKRKKIYM